MGNLPARTLDEDHDQVRRAHGYHLLTVKGQRLLCQGDGMPGLYRDDGRANLDARRLGRDDRGRRQRVEVVGDLRDPDGREASSVSGTSTSREPSSTNSATLVS